MTGAVAGVFALLAAVPPAFAEASLHPYNTETEILNEFSHYKLRPPPGARFCSYDAPLSIERWGFIAIWGKDRCGDYIPPNTPPVSLSFSVAYPDSDETFATFQQECLQDVDGIRTKRAEEKGPKVSGLPSWTCVAEADQERGAQYIKLVEVRRNTTEWDKGELGTSYEIVASGPLAEKRSVEALLGGVLRQLRVAPVGPLPLFGCRKKEIAVKLHGVTHWVSEKFPNVPSVTLTLSPQILTIGHAPPFKIRHLGEFVYRTYPPNDEDEACAALYEIVSGPRDSDDPWPRAPYLQSTGEVRYLAVMHPVKLEPDPEFELSPKHLRILGITAGGLATSASLTRNTRASLELEPLAP